jgi:hypothetical protein
MPIRTVVLSPEQRERYDELRSRYSEAERKTHQIALDVLAFQHEQFGMTLEDVMASGSPRTRLRVIESKPGTLGLGKRKSFGICSVKVISAPLNGVGATMPRKPGSLTVLSPHSLGFQRVPSEHPLGPIDHCPR